MSRNAKSALREPVAAKVPEVTKLFWAVKLLTTGMGEAAADALAKTNLLLAAAVGFIGFGVAMRWQFRARTYRPEVYWFAVAMVAVFGTMGADAAHILFKLPYVVSTALCAVALLIVFRWWYRSEGTLSIHSIVTRRRERFYWLAVLATFAMGTAVGDLTATTLHLGFLGSIALFGVLICVPALGWSRLGWNTVASFWAAYVLTRPLGASIADWLGKPHSFGRGLGLGDGRVALVATVVIAVIVAWMTRNRYGIQAIDHSSTRGKQRLLYHLTTRAAFAELLVSGQIRPTPVAEGNSIVRELPSVVWLSDDPSELDGAAGADIRLLISTDRALRWRTWAYIYRLPRRTRDEPGQREGRSSERCWVLAGPIDRFSVVRVDQFARASNRWEPLEELAFD